MGGPENLNSKLHRSVFSPSVNLDFQIFFPQKCKILWEVLWVCAAEDWSQFFNQCYIKRLSVSVLTNFEWIDRVVYRQKSDVNKIAVVWCTVRLRLCSISFHSTSVMFWKISIRFRWLLNFGMRLSDLSSPRMKKQEHLLGSLIMLNLFIGAILDVFTESTPVLNFLNLLLSVFKEQYPASKFWNLLKYTLETTGC